MTPQNPKSPSGSDQNLKTRGPQLVYETPENIRFINFQTEHDFNAKAQLENLDEVSAWLKKYPGGIDFDQ
jgi:hypothetical protein